MNLRGYLVFAVLGCNVVCVRGAELLLVGEGRPNARIVMPAEPHELEQLAAQELSFYIEKCSGATLPASGTQVPAAAEILVGVRDEGLRRRLQLDSLPFDGFVVSCGENRLVLAGNVPEGTLNAVYGFLESDLGVRWFVPTTIGEHVPTQRTVSVPEGQRRVEPRFVNRRNHGIDLSIRGDGAIWRRRNRITSHDLSVPFNRYSHNLYQIVPPSRFGQSHPEYYPVRGGERYVPPNDHIQNWQPCTTNPEVAALAIAAAGQWFEQHPRSNFFSVGMNDSGCFCECAACRALDVPGEEFRGHAMISDRYFAFVKTVADAVASSHPGKFITCIAYSVVESPPRRVQLPDNVGVVITQDVAQWHDPEYRKADMAFAEAWSRAAGAFGTYDYTGLTWMMPRVYPRLMAESLRFYDRLGAVATTNEAYPTWWYAAPQMYLRAKLMWDPSRDVDTVLREFYTGFFGPAADDMGRFYEVLEACMTKERPGRWFEGLGSVIQQLDLWDQSDLEACLGALASAERRAGTQAPYAERLAFVRRGFRWAEAMLREYWLAQEVRGLASARGTPSGDLLGCVRRLLQAGREREEVWQAIRDDQLVSGVYRLVFESFEGRLATWRSFLQSSVSIGTSAVLAEPGAASRQRVRELVALAGDEELRQELRARLWTIEHPEAPNLCRNPGFGPTASAASEHPEGVDWVATDMPPGWSKWAIRKENRPNLTWERDGGRSDGPCVRARGVQEACFIYNVPAKPGERYCASAWARAEGGPEATQSLVVQWKDSTGAWVWSKARREALLPADAGDWRQLSVAFVVPEGVANAVVLLVTKKQGPEDSAWFDDARVVRLPDALRDATP